MKAMMRSLFWKIFLIIWVTNMLLITSGSLLFRSEYQRQFSELAENERLNAFTEYLISRYEAGMDTRDYRAGRPGTPGILIQDLDTGLQVFSSDNLGGSDGSSISYDYVSPNDGHYRVHVYVIQPVVADEPNFPLNLAVIGIFITAAFSWLLTYLITRPLIKLKAHVEGLGGDLSAKLDHSLLERGDEFGSLAKAVDEMSNRILTLIESKQRLFYDVSHELRAPLARMQVAAEIVRMRAESKGEDLKIYDRVDREILALEQLITELMMYAKEDNAQFPVEPVDLRHLLSDVISDQDFSSAEHRVHLKVDSSGVDKLEINTKQVLLERALKNLVENALKYSPKDAPVDVALTPAGQGYQISIRDSGPGIPEDKLGEVFNPFTRLHGESVEGIGLGLSIVQRAVDDIGGKLELANHKEGGLEAKIELPA